MNVRMGEEELVRMRETLTVKKEIAVANRIFSTFVIIKIVLYEKGRLGLRTYRKRKAGKNR